MITIGTCSRCGGPVTTPSIWHGIGIPPATCQRCGATARRNHGPVIPMDPPWPVMPQTLWMEIDYIPPTGPTCLPIREFFEHPPRTYPQDVTCDMPAQVRGVSVQRFY